MNTSSPSLPHTDCNPHASLPWRVVQAKTHEFSSVVAVDSSGAKVFIASEGDNRTQAEAENNAAFIVSAVNQFSQGGVLQMRITALEGALKNIARSSSFAGGTSIKELQGIAHAALNPPTE